MTNISRVNLMTNIIHDEMFPCYIVHIEKLPVWSDFDFIIYSSITFAQNKSHRRHYLNASPPQRYAKLSS